MHFNKRTKLTKTAPQPPLHTMVLHEFKTFTTPSFAPREIVLAIEHDTENVPLRTGCRLWSSSYALVEYLASEDTHACVRGKHVLELGAGIGAGGLAAAALGAASVCVTDRDDAVLALAHANALRNGWYGARAGECEVSVRAVDWADEDTYVTINGGYDVIIAADMLYLEEHAEALARCIDGHLADHGVFIAAFGVRRLELAQAFEQALVTRRFDVKTRALDYVNEDMVSTAKEYAHDDEITAKGGYRLIECTRRKDDDDALADFAAEFAEVSLDSASRMRALNTHNDDDGDDDDDAFDLERACAYTVNVSAQEIESGLPKDETASNAAESLREHGFVILQPHDVGNHSALIPREDVAALNDAGETYLNELLEGVKAKGIDPTRDIFRFSEICSRARAGLRYDYTRPEHEDVKARLTSSGRKAIDQWQALEKLVAPWVEPILARAYKDDKFKCVSVGCVTSEPGAPEQHFHSDGRIFGIVNVFVPLVATANGADAAQGTAFIHGSHLWDHDAAYVTSKEARKQAAAPRCLPEIHTPGSLLLYDYRVMHKGGANNSRKRRPLAYIMYGANKADSWNFPRNDSLWDDNSSGVL